MLEEVGVLSIVSPSFSFLLTSVSTSNVVVVFVLEEVGVLSIVSPPFSFLLTPVSTSNVLCRLLGLFFSGGAIGIEVGVISREDIKYWIEFPPNLSTLLRASFVLYNDTQLNSFLSISQSK